MTIGGLLQPGGPLTFVVYPLIALAVLVLIAAGGMKYYSFTWIAICLVMIICTGNFWAAFFFWLIMELLFWAMGAEIIEED